MVLPRRFFVKQRGSEELDATHGKEFQDQFDKQLKKIDKYLKDNKRQPDDGLNDNGKAVKNYVKEKLIDFSLDYNGLGRDPGFKSGKNIMDTIKEGIPVASGLAGGFLGNMFGIPGGAAAGATIGSIAGDAISMFLPSTERFEQIEKGLGRSIPTPGSWEMETGLQNPYENQKADSKSGIFDGVTNNIKNIKEKVLTGVSDIQGVFANLPTGIKEELDNADPDFMSNLTNILNDTELSTQKKAAGIQDLLAGLPQDVRDKLVNEGAGFMDGITSAIDDTSLNADEKVALMKEKLAAFPAEVKENLSKDGQNFLEFVDTTLNKTGLSAEEKTAAIKQKLGSLPENVKNELAEADPNYLGMLTEGMDGTAFAATNTALSMVSSIGGLPPNIKKGLEKGAGFMSPILGELTKQASMSYNKSVWLGEQIPDGVGVGQMDARAMALQAATRVASGILGAFTSFLKINSPSKLMRDKVGKSITEGIGVGMEQDLPNMFYTMQSSMNEEIGKFERGVVSGANLQAAFAGGAGTVNNSNSTETINIYQPVKSPAEVAKAIRLQRKELAFE